MARNRIDLDAGGRAGDGSAPARSGHASGGRAVPVDDLGPGTGGGQGTGHGAFSPLRRLVADRHGAVLALFRVTLREARGSSPNPGGEMNPRRPRWVRCGGGIAEGRNDDGTRNDR